jgi:hypothetical protein
MPAATLDLSGSTIIEQNSFWSIELFHPGDITGTSLKGQIKEDYGGKMLAEIQMRPAEFIIPIQKTKFFLFIQPGTTAQIPVPPAGKNWVYDVLILRPGASPRRLLQGKVFVSPGVTRA